MQKIYVLLRNDQQTGPYSLQELIQFDLKPYDLIWIEGKSAGWYYPQEIGALHPYLPFLSQKQKPSVKTTTATQPVFVAPPPVQVRQEPPVVPPSVEPMALYTPQEVRQPPRPASANLEEAVFAQFKAPVVTEEKMAVGTASPKPKKKMPSAGLVAIASIMIVGGVFTASWIMNPHSSKEESGIFTAPAAENEIATPAVAPIDNTNSTPASGVKPAKQKTRSSAAPTQTVVQKTVVVQQRQHTAASDPVIESTPEETVDAANDEAPVAGNQQSSNAPQETTAPQEKKKSLGDKILDIFRGKSSEQKQEEAKPADTENSERRSRRRDGETNLAQMVSIRFDVPNSWMMGIKGAKAILYNRSNEDISKAVIEVSYYNDDSELLQKKTVIFSKVDAKESKTVAIPDHSTATKVEYSIVSVEGQPGA